jgi:hypothetical protein
LLRGAKDVYHGKLEIYTLAILWVTSISLAFTYDRIAPPHVRVYAPSLLFLLFAQVVNFIVSNLVPLAYACHFDLIAHNKEGSFADFSILLKSINFRYKISSSTLQSLFSALSLLTPFPPFSAPSSLICFFLTSF